MKLYCWVGIVVLVALGIITMVPAPTSMVHKVNLVGYYSYDPFAPVSALILFIIAGGIYWFGKRREKKNVA